MNRKPITLEKLPSIISGAIKNAYEMSAKEVCLHNTCVSERLDALDTFLANINRCIGAMADTYYVSKEDK